MPDLTKPARSLSPATYVAALAIATLAGLLLVAAEPLVALMAVLTAGSELLLALLIFLAAAGWGSLALRRLLPTSAPRAIRALTSCAAGLWMLSSAVMIAGSLAAGLLTPYIWWPVVAAGLILALWQGWPAIRDFKPSRVSPTSLIWLLAAAAAGIWLSGAMQPAGFVGRLAGDSYDVLEYHLQLPRLYFEANQITPLQNCFSYFPLGNEMLYLLAMCLRNGAYAGMYLATLLHGLQGVVAVAALYYALKPASRAGAIFTAIMLATAPGVIYLSWLAKTELAQVMYLALALVWLKQWIEHGHWRQALAVGLMIGGACATKYVAIGIVAVPILAAMTALALSKPRRLWHVALAGAIALLLLSPWLIRNVAAVGNPVFPLATKTLGQGYWTDEQVQRWASGTGTAKLPPVPAPPGWTMPPQPPTSKMIFDALLIQPFLSPPLVVLAALAAISALAFRRDRWRLALAGVLAVQFGMWSISHEFPWRFLIPATVTMALLAGEMLAAIGVKLSAGKPSRGWALPAVIVTACAVWGLYSAGQVFRAETAAGVLPPLDGQQIAAEASPFDQAAKLPPGSRIMLIGEAKAFYFPPGTIATPVFDPQPLEKMIDQGLSAPEILARLKAMGVTHLWVDWSEILRLANTYGFPASLSTQALQNVQNHKPPALPILTQLETLGAKPTNLKNVGVTVYTLP